MRFLLFFSLILTPILGNAQQDTVSLKVMRLNDSVYLALSNLGNGLGSNAVQIITHKKEEQDSLKKGFIPFQWQSSLKTEAILKKAKEEREKFEKKFKELMNTPIPDFDARDTEGVLHRPINYAGRVWALHFWNFWDHSFESEIPILQQLLTKYQDQGLQILSFVDLEIMESEKTKLEKSPLGFPLVSNARSFMHSFIKVAHSTPYLILVDKQGKMQLIYVQHELSSKKSAFYNGGFEAKIKELLSEN